MIGCATGEEAYSLAMVFKDVMDKLKPGKKMTLQVFATDLDKDAINKARQGRYPENIRADVTPKLARETIESITVLGVLHASAEIKTALADRIH